MPARCAAYSPEIHSFVNRAAIRQCSLPALRKPSTRFRENYVQAQSLVAFAGHEPREFNDEFRRHHANQPDASGTDRRLA